MLVLPDSQRRAVWVNGVLALRTAPHPAIFFRYVDASELVAKTYRDARALLSEKNIAVSWGARGLLWRDAAHAVGISLGVITYGKGDT